MCHVDVTLSFPPATAPKALVVVSVAKILKHLIATSARMVTLSFRLVDLVVVIETELTGMCVNLYPVNVHVCQLSPVKRAMSALMNTLDCLTEYVNRYVRVDFSLTHLIACLFKNSVPATVMELYQERHATM